MEYSIKELTFSCIFTFFLDVRRHEIVSCIFTFIKISRGVSFIQKFEGECYFDTPKRGWCNLLLNFYVLPFEIFKEFR